MRQRPNTGIEEVGERQTTPRTPQPGGSSLAGKQGDPGVDLLVVAGGAADDSADRGAAEAELQAVQRLRAEAVTVALIAWNGCEDADHGAGEQSDPGSLEDAE